MCLWFLKKKIKRERESIIDWGGACCQGNWIGCWCFSWCQLDALLNLLDHLWRVVSMMYDLFKALMTQSTRIVSSPPGWSVTGSPKTEDLKRTHWARPSSVLWSGVYTPGLGDNVPSVYAPASIRQLGSQEPFMVEIFLWAGSSPLQLGPPSFTFLLYSFQAVVHSPGLWGHILFIFVGCCPAPSSGPGISGRSW